MAISFVGTRYGRLSSSLEGRALWDELADFLGGLTDLDQLFGVMVRASILRAWYSGYETVQVFGMFFRRPSHARLLVDYRRT